MKTDKPEIIIKRVDVYLHRVVPIMDNTKKVLRYRLSPSKIEFRPSDLMQIIVGVSILAVPIAFTKETWTLGECYPLQMCFCSTFFL